MDTRIEILSGNVCPYCGSDSEYIDNSYIYAESTGMIYICKPCDAYIGTHKDQPLKSLGSLANKELRDKRVRVHALFDPMWQRNEREGVPRHVARSDAYRWLSMALELDPEYTHIGMFDLEMCNKAIKAIYVAKLYHKP